MKLLSYGEVRAKGQNYWPRTVQIRDLSGTAADF